MGYPKEATFKAQHTGNGFTAGKQYAFKQASQGSRIYETLNDNGHERAEHADALFTGTPSPHFKDWREQSQGSAWAQSMNEKHKAIALDMAMEGKDFAYIVQKLATGHGLSAAAAREVAAYVCTGARAGNDTKKQPSTAGNFAKRSSRKALAVMLKFYDANDLKTSVGDLIADLMHLSAAKGWTTAEGKKIKLGFDFEAAYQQGHLDFNAEALKEN